LSGITVTSLGKEGRTVSTPSFSVVSFFSPEQAVKEIANNKPDAKMCNFMVIFCDIYNK